MKNKSKYLLLIALIALTGCSGTSDDSDTSLLPSETITSENSLDPSTSQASSDITSTEVPSDSEVPTSELVPLLDPDVAGLSRSEAWPSADLASFLAHDENIVMPVFASEVDFHHGLYNEELFYRVMTRVRSIDDFNTYKSLLQTEYDFSVEVEGGTYYAESMYDDVRIYLEYKVVGGRNEVSFDFFDGSGDSYDGLEAVNNLATFNLRNEEALTSISATRGKWEVRPATFTVYKKTSGYGIGGDAHDHLANPLRFYPGQQATFAVSGQYYIEKIVILAASGYAEETVLNGTLSNGVATDNVDWVTITPSGQVSSIDYTLNQVMDVGQVRWLEIRLTMAKKV